MKRYLHTVAVLASALTRRFFRDKTALFFTFLFPLLFLFVFGSIFKGDDGAAFDVALINHSQTKFSQDFVSGLQKDTGGLKINQDIITVDDAKQRMGRGEIDSIIELPTDFGQPNDKGVPSGKMAVYYEESSPQTGQTLASVMQGALNKLNTALTGSQPPLSVEQKATKTTSLTQFDYTFSGLIGFSILSMAIFGMANGFPVDKKAGFLRRLRATPLRASQLILATALEYLLIAAISMALMLVVGVMMFEVQMRGDYLNFAIFALLSVITMFGFGLAIGGWAKNENQSAPLSNLVAFPMMFLSGTFFPRFLMPEWLQSLTAYIPLTPIVDGLRLILTEGKTIVDLGPQLAIMGIWTVAIYFIAIKVFRWE